MRFLKFIILFIAIRPFAIAQGQDLQWYNTDNNQVETMGSEDISADFGRRECCANKWHDGLDITAAQNDDDIGYKIMAVSSGRITKIKRQGAYKIVFTQGDRAGHNFGYGHIFKSSSTVIDNDFYLIGYGTDNNAIVIKSEGVVLTDAELSENEEFTFDNVTYYANNGTLKNTIEEGEVLAPLGDSDAVGAHIHLYLLRNANNTDVSELRRWSNLKDPLNQIAYQAPNYKGQVEIRQYTDDDNNTVMPAFKNTGKYNNDTEHYILNPSIRVRVNLPGVQYAGGGQYMENGTIMDLNSVELLIRKWHEPNTAFLPIKGAYFESKIIEGGRYTESRYPSHNNPPGNTTGGDSDYIDWQLDYFRNGGVDIASKRATVATFTAGFGDYRKTGIVSQAYTGSNADWWTTAIYGTGYKRGEWDDYFFNDFPTRIDDEDDFGRDTPMMAERIKDARYPDGRYVIVAKARNLQYRDWTSNGHQFVIDNFRPYVSRVMVQKVDSQGEVLFLGGFDEDLEETYSLNLQKAVVNEPLYITVEFSESMDPDHVGIRYGSQGSFTSAGSNYSVDHKKFRFNVDGITSLEQDIPLTLVIQGRDLNNNQLQTDPSIVSLRTGDNSWTDGPSAPTPGNDTNYTFNTEDVSCGVTPPNGANAQVATILSGATGSCVFVAFDVNKQNPATNEPVVFAPFGSEDPSLTYQWVFDYSDAPGHVSSATPATSTDREVTVMYNSSGSKTVRLQICSGGSCKTEEIVGFMDVNGTIPPLLINSISVNGLGSGSGVVGDDFSLNANVQGGQGNLTYYWNFGDGSNYTDNTVSNPTVSYSSLGNKTISLTVIDNSGRSVTRSFNNKIRIVNYPPLVVEIENNDCIDVTFSNGYATFSAYVTGGKPEPRYNKSYYWSFGDGEYSPSINPSHTYNQPGYYTVSLIVCDDYGCSEDKINQCIYMGENGSNTGFWNVLMDANSAGLPKPVWIPTSPTSGSWQCPTFIPEFSVGEPIIFDINVDKGGGGKDEDYTYVWDFNAGGPCGSSRPNNPSPSTARSEPDNPSYLPGPRTHTVTYDQAGTYYVSVSITGVSSATLEYFAIKVVDGLGSVSCRSSLGNIEVSNTCLEQGSLPVLTYITQFNNCPVDKVDLFQVIGGNEVLAETDISSGISLDFAWNGGSPDIVNQFVLKSYSGSYVSGVNNFEISFSEKPQLSLVDTYQICLGASAQIGTDPSGDNSYLWSSVGGSDLNYLSDNTISNPMFVAYDPGITQYQYDLTVTDYLSGCTTTERVTINVTGIDAQSYSQTLLVGSVIQLESPVNGGGGDYEYEWSPDTYLDNPRVANPIIAVPDLAGNIDYTVKVSFRGETCKTDPNNPVVSLTFENPPPRSLSVDLDGETPFPILNWQHDGIAGSYEIQKSVDGANYATVATVDGNTFSYQDVTSCDDPPGSNFCYKIRARNVSNVLIPGESNSDCEIFTGVAEGYSRTLTLPSNDASVVLFRPDVQGLNYTNFDYQWSPSTFLDDPNSPNPMFNIPNYGTSILYNVDISYQGQCTASANVLIQVENPLPDNFSVDSYGVWPNSQFPSISWTENGIVNYYILYRSVDGGATWEEVTRGNDIVDHIDFDCIYSTVEYCYKLEVYDFNDQFRTIGPDCFTVPFSAGLTSDFPHSVDGSAYLAINKSSVFNGFGGNTIIPIQNFGNANFGSVDAASGSPVLQLDFRDAILDRVGPQVISNGSYDFWPTAMCETDNYFFIVGATNESGYESGILNLIRYTKSNGAIYRRRLKSPTGNYMKINAPALIADLGNDDFVVATSYSVGTNDVGVWSIMKPIDWTADTWEYEHYSLTSSYDVYMSDLDMYNGIVYVTVKHIGLTGNSANNEHFRSVGYEIRKIAGYPDRFDQEYYASASAQASVPIHPKSVFHSNKFYSVSEMGTNEIYVKQESYELNRNWTKSFTLSQSDFEVKALEIFEGELFAVSQNGTSLLIVTFDLNGNKTSEKYFEISGLDKILGATKIDDQVVINYTKNVSGGVGEVYSSVFGGSKLEISGDKRLCWWEATGNDIYNAENFDVADDCNFYVNNGQTLELNASNRITLHPGFSATQGSSVSLRINVPTPTEDCPPPPGARVESPAASVEVDIVDEQVGENSLLANIYAYPNPTRDWVNIAYVLQEYTDIKVTFYDIEGKQVALYNYSDTNYINDKINVGDLAKGIYVLKIESEIETRTIKISIK